MRPLSVTSDLREAIQIACSEASECGLELDQIAGIIRQELATLERAEAERDWEQSLERAGYRPDGRFVKSQPE